MKNLKTRLMAMLTMLVLCLGLCPAVSADAAQSGAIQAELKTVRDFVYCEKNTGEIMGIVSGNYITAYVSVVLPSGKKGVYYVNADIKTAEEMADGSIRMGKHELYGSNYDIAIIMTKETYERYKTFAEGSYDFTIQLYDDTKPIEGLTFPTSGKCVNYIGSSGEPINLGGTICKPEYFGGSVTYTLLYAKLDYKKQLMITKNSDEVNLVHWYKLDENGKVESQDHIIMIETDFTLDAGTYILSVVCYDTSFDTFYIGDLTGLVKASSVTMSETMDINEGESAYLCDSLVTIPDTTNEKPVWTSDNENIVKVAQNGKVTAVAPGKATVTVSYENVSAKCLVTVSAKAKCSDTSADNGLQKQTIKVNTKKAKLSKKKTIDLTKCVTVKDKAKLTFAKKSGNKLITISKNGKLTVKKGLKKGTYKVKVKISAAATGKYEAASVTKNFNIKVK